MARAGRSRRYSPASVAFTPSAISGLVLWLRADLGITTATGVSQWADQSGVGDSNRNLVQATGANQPAYVTSNAGYNNKPTLHLNGTTHTMPAAGNWSVGPPSTGTMFFVCNTASSALLVLFADTVTTLYEFYQNGNTVANFNNGSAFSATVSNMQNPHIYAIDLNSGGTYSIFQDAMTAAGTGAGGSGTPSNIGLAANAGFLWSGDIAEMIVYNSRLVTSDRARVMHYLGARYNITIGP